MLRPNLVVRQRHIAAVLAPLTFALSMSISHQALALCVLSSSVSDSTSTYTCTDQSTFSATQITDWGEVSGASTNNDASGSTAGNGNKTIRLKATPLSATVPGTAVFTNEGTIGAVLGTATNKVTGGASGNQDWAIWGIKASNGDGIGTVNITNQADKSIFSTHNGVGLAAGIFLQGDVEEANIVNYGNISVTRGDLTIDANSGTAISATATQSGVVTTAGASAVTSGTLRIAAAIHNNEEEIELEHITNYGTIEATGKFTTAIFGRPNTMFIENYGIIRQNTADHTTGPANTDNYVGAAIVNWDGRVPVL